MKTGCYHVPETCILVLWLEYEGVRVKEYAIDHRCECHLNTPSETEDVLTRETFHNIQSAATRLRRKMEHIRARGLT